MVFVAGGVGINPVMSMISALDQVGTAKRLGGMPRVVRVLYSARREIISGDGDGKVQEEDILFERRLAAIAQKWNRNENNAEQVDYRYSFFQTGKPTEAKQKANDPGNNMTTHFRRISHDDLFDALGPDETRSNTVVYICGLPTMTDEFVELLKNTPGLDENRVLCEKWW